MRKRYYLIFIVVVSVNTFWNLIFAQTPLKNKDSSLKSSILFSEVITDGFGVQLKTHSNSSIELDRIKALGLSWVRHGFHWAIIEKEKGVYDFSNYDRLVEDCHKRGLKIVGCIALNNKEVYGAHAKDEPARSAYAKFAAKLVDRYKDYNIVWEIWNEPNTMTFWGRHGGVGNSEQYAKEYLELVKATVPAMRSANPNCIILGGSVSNMWTESYKWMNYCFERGLLETGIDILSVHPYGVKSPEDYIEAYDTTRKMMANAGGPILPLFDSERGFPLNKLEGYSGGDEKMSHEYQAWHIVRQYIFDNYLNVLGTIWYEWIGEGREKGFSLYDEENALPVYKATKTLIEQLKGYRLENRIDVGSSRDFVLKFINNSGETKLVVWTAPPSMESPDMIVPHSVSISFDGKTIPELRDIYGIEHEIKAENKKIKILLTGAPQYIFCKKK